MKKRNASDIVIVTETVCACVFSSLVVVVNKPQHPMCFLLLLWQLCLVVLLLGFRALLPHSELESLVPYLCCQVLYDIIFRFTSDAQLSSANLIANMNTVLMFQIHHCAYDCRSQRNGILDRYVYAFIVAGNKTKCFVICMFISFDCLVSTETLKRTRPKENITVYCVYSLRCVPSEIPLCAESAIELHWWSPSIPQKAIIAFWCCKFRYSIVCISEMMLVRCLPIFVIHFMEQIT